MGREASGPAYDVYVVGKYAYLCTGGAVAISIPLKPKAVGRMTTPGIVKGIYVVGDYAYVADGDMGGLRVIEVTDPKNLHEVGYV